MAAVLSLAAVTAWGQARPETPVTSPPLERFVPLEAIVNGQKTGTWAFVERLNQLYASRDALDEWRVQVRDAGEPITVRGTQYWPLSAIPGFSVKVNYANQSVEIGFSPEAFAATKLTSTIATRPKVTPVLPSVFANYELNYSRSDTRGSPVSQDVGALVELGTSTPWGVLTSSHVGRNLSRDPTSNTSGWTRLETTFTRHLPERNEVVRLGDASTRPGLWGRNVYFGGLQYATDYSLTPGFLTQPLPVLRGVSSAPSTVELYVNDVLRQVSQVPAGPFAIDNTIGLTGSGEARLVVRDVLGREVVITQPFFSSAQLLATGLADWSFEAGRLREDLGIVDSSYGSRFAAGTWRRGFSDWITLEARGEATPTMRAVGFGAIAALPGDILGRFAFTGSRDDAHGAGHQWLVGLERQWLRSSAYFQAQGATQSFRTLGLSDTLLPARFQWAANVSHTTNEWGSFALSLAGIRRYDAPALTTFTLNYAFRFGPKKLNTVTLSYSRAFGSGAGGGSSVGITAQIPLEDNRQVTATAQSHAGVHDLFATASQAEGLNGGLGWRVLGGYVTNEAHVEAGAYYTGQYGRVYSDISASPSQNSLRFGASGGLVFTGGRGFATRRLDQGFAVVEIKGFDDIGVGIGTNVITRTNASGIALLPNLSPWQLNQVRLDPKDLPVSAEVQSIEELVVPSWRSGVKVDFPVRGGRAALVKIQLDDGEPAPAGAIVRIEGDKQEFYVARRGEAYVTGIEPNSRVVLTWKDQRCVLELKLPPAGKDEIPRVGPVACKGVKR